MKRSSLPLVILTALILAPPVHAQSGPVRIPDALSANGLPGLVHTPVASGLPTGAVRFSISTMPDYPRIASIRDNFAWQANFGVAIGLWDRLVIGGRATEVRLEEPKPPVLFILPDGGFAVIRRDFEVRDMSANVSLLVLRESDVLPAITVAAEDVGGAASKFEARYAVASKTLWDRRVRLSAGYGVGPDVLDGAFGGVEFSPIPGLALLAEYDAERFNGGARLNLIPERWVTKGIPQITASALWAESEGASFSVGLGTPLAGPAPSDTDASRVTRSGTTGSTSGGVAQALADLGFEDVAVEMESPGTLRVEYENRVYNQSELDGLAVVLSTVAATASSDITTLDVVVKSARTPVVEVVVSEAALSDLRAGGIPASGSPGMEARWAERTRPGPPTVNPSTGHLDFELTPLVEHFVFSEFGVAEARLNLIPSLRAQPLPGLTLEAAARVPLYQSSRYFLLGGSRPDPQLERATIGYVRGVAMPNGWKAFGELSVGQMNVDDLGVRQQIEVLAPGGTLQFGADVAVLGPETSTVDRLYAVGTVRALLPEFGTRISLSAGQFMDEDKGVTVDFTRFFGDTQISLFMKDTDNSRVAGIGFTVPLSFRKDLKPRTVRPRMTSAFGAAVQTVVGNETNPILRDVGRFLSPTTSISARYLDFNRLNPTWVSVQLQDPRFWVPR